MFILTLFRIYVGIFSIPVENKYKEFVTGWRGAAIEF